MKNVNFVNNSKCENSRKMWICECSWKFEKKKNYEKCEFCEKKIKKLKFMENSN